ncbi:MAG: GDSL-type esterase/lipase family protein [Eubacterium sp.]|nr:GDSL-type esterase/lipase family protein [Eubacterium sp.]
MKTITYSSKKGKLKLRAFIILLAILVLISVFIFNLIKKNHNANISKQEIQKNVEKVAKFNFSTVVDIEAELQKLEAIENGNQSKEKNYRMIFSNCAIVGDSITEGLSVYGFLGAEQVFSEIGDAVSKGGAMFDKAAATYPKAVFFSYGMNDMGNYTGNAEDFIKDYTSLIKKFQKSSPKTKIYVNGISKPDSSAVETNKILGNYSKFNKEIKAMCKKLKITYIETSQILEKDPSLYAADGIHVQPAYYTIWLDLMQEKAGLK